MTALSFIREVIEDGFTVKAGSEDILISLSWEGKTCSVKIPMNPSSRDYHMTKVFTEAAMRKLKKHVGLDPRRPLPEKENK